MNNNKKQNEDFQREFVRDQLVNAAKNAAKVGISAEIFEAWLYTFADELNFKDIMKISKEDVQ